MLARRDAALRARRSPDIPWSDAQRVRSDDPSDVRTREVAEIDQIIEQATEERTER